MVGDTRVTITGGVTLPQNVSYLKLKNLEFAGASTIGCYGSSTEYATLNLVIENCAFTKASGNCVYISPQISSLTVTKCAFSAPATESYQKAYFIWPYAAKSIVITDNVFNGGGITRAPIHLGDGHPEGTTATVEGNTITGFERGVQLAFINEAAQNIVTIDNNTFENITLSDVTISAPAEVGTVYIHEFQKNNTSVTYTDNKLTGESARAITSEHLTLAASDVIKAFTGNTLNGQALGTLKENVFSTYVVQIGEQKYTTLSGALETAGTMGGDVTVTLLDDVDVSGSVVRTFDLSASELTGLTIRGASKDVQITSGVDGHGIDGPTYCPVLTVKLPGAATFTVENLTLPNDLLFDAAGENAVVVQNCVFNGAQSGYPQAKSISYLNNLFEFKGTTDGFYTNNAYPVWYKSDREQSVVFNGNTVKGYRGVHIETRADIRSTSK